MASVQARTAAGRVDEGLLLICFLPRALNFEFCGFVVLRGYELLRVETVSFAP